MPLTGQFERLVILEGLPTRPLSPDGRYQRFRAKQLACLRVATGVGQRYPKRPAEPLSGRARIPIWRSGRRLPELGDESLKGGVLAKVFQIVVDQ
jgi:hypothetical protein